MGDRDAAEEQFFSLRAIEGFPKESCWRRLLRATLSQVLLQQVRNEPPSLVEEIEINVNEI
jgi:hypothetical protein